MARAGRLRVIAGSARGRRLVAPSGGARPTTDRVKESVFGALGEARFDGAVVLDLYAGSGALTIEALSRGAERAVLVDSAREARAAIETNLEKTGFAASARIVTTLVTRFLGQGPPTEAPFALVFLDPPYETPANEIAAVLALLDGPGWLAADARIVVERGTTDEPPVLQSVLQSVLPEGWATTWERAYGDTLVAVATAHP